MARESANNRARTAANQLLIHNRILETQEIINKINEVTNESIKRIANSILATPMTIASIGPIKKLESIDRIQKRIV